MTKTKAKSKIDSGMLKKYSWGLVAEEFYNNRDSDSAAWTLATMAKEGVDLGLSAEAYKVGLKGAVEIMGQKYRSFIAEDATVQEYYDALGMSTAFKGANMTFNELEDKMEKARHTIKLSTSTDEEKLKAQEKFGKLAQYQQLVGAGESSFSADKRKIVETTRKKDLIQRILDSEAA